MLLTLEVIKCRGLPQDDHITAEFENRGGTLGRSEDNDLVLPDPEKFTSRKHAEIRFENNRFSIADLSLSGTYIDDNEQPLQHDTAELSDGMTLGIGDYQILVKIDQKNEHQRPQAADEDFDIPPSPEFIDSAESDTSADVDVSDFTVDPFAADPLAGPDIGRNHSLDASALEQGTSLNDTLASVQVDKSSNPSSLPDDFDIEDLFNDSAKPMGFDNDLFRPVGHESKDSGEHSESPGGEIEPTSKEQTAHRQKVSSKPLKPTPGSRPIKTTTPKPSHSERAVRAFFKGAGITDEQVYKDLAADECMQLVGVLFREMISGIMDVLRGRAETKSQFRLAVTTIGSADNNPLKHSATVDDAIEALLNPRHKGFLDPKDAVRRGINDMMNHQLAMTAGIQAALRELIRRFDPESFEDRYREGFVFQKKAKCWDSYTNEYPALSNRALEEFFGEEFVRAYEAQMQTLKSINEQ